MKTLTFKVNDMTCAACHRAVERTAKKVAGVEDAVVNPATDKLTVQIKDNEEQIRQTVEQAVLKAGYGIEIRVVEKTVVLPIGGMTCSACSKAVERSVAKLPGVISISVNDVTEKATLLYRPEEVRMSQIRQAIINVGYEPKEVDQTNNQLENEAIQKKAEVDGIKHKFYGSMLFTIPLLYLAMGEMLGLPLPTFLSHNQFPVINGSLQLLLTLPVIGLGSRFYKMGFKSMMHGSPNMDALIAIGTGAAMLYSIGSLLLMMRTSTQSGESYLYFESAAVILTLIQMGKYLEARSKGQTGEAIRKLMGLVPKTAKILVEDQEIEIPVDEVEVGDVFMLRPGEKAPVDGKVVEGHGAFDEAMISGESMPVEKTVGDLIIGATLNKNGYLKCKAEKVGRDTLLAQIIQLVENAQGSRAPIAKLADKVSTYFVPTVMALALLSSVGWYLAGESVTFALKVFVSVMVIACPCALGLATPTAIMVGTGKGAEKGILIKSGEALESINLIDTVVFDKTGTLTEGKPAMIAFERVSNEETFILEDLNSVSDNLLQLTASLEKASEHPLAEAFMAEAEKRNIMLLNVDHFTAIVGRGVSGEVGGKKILIGSKRLMTENGFLIERELLLKSEEHAALGRTPVWVAVENKVIAMAAIGDTVRGTAIEAVNSLKNLGIRVAMITGDNKQTAKAVADQCGIEHVMAEVLPVDKAAEIERLKLEGYKVAMVGDGINDAPAMASANVGIAIGSGTDVAVASADIVLVRNNVMDVVRALLLGRETIKNVRQNLFWAFAYNLVGIPVAAGLLYLFGGPLLNPMFAAAAMSLSSVSVVSNALRLNYFDDGTEVHLEWCNPDFGWENND